MAGFQKNMAGFQNLPCLKIWIQDDVKFLFVPAIFPKENLRAAMYRNTCNDTQVI